MALGDFPVDIQEMVIAVPLGWEGAIIGAEDAVNPIGVAVIQIQVLKRLPAPS